MYVVPQFTGIALEAEDVARLSEHRNIIGIKESSGNVQRVSEILVQSQPGFHVLVGSAPTLFPSLALGALGGILAISCCLPELCVDLHEAFFRGEMEKARHLQQLLLEPARVVLSTYGVPGIKYAMDRLGYYGGPPRSPLQPPTAEERKQLDEVLARLEARFTAAR
jgi:4-hydroxy-2-oxoglutarate aldolase